MDTVKAVVKLVCIGIGLSILLAAYVIFREAAEFFVFAASLSPELAVIILAVVLVIIAIIGLAVLGIHLIMRTVFS